MAGADTSVLSIRDVSFSYNGHPVLESISLELGEGELVGVVGPNGCGKSTLLKLVSGVLQPHGGAISLGGVDVGTLSRRQLATRVAVVPQTAVVPPTFTALEIALMGRTPHLSLLQWESRDDYRKTQHAMELTDCWELANQPIGMVSGGERQRILLARALAQETPLLLLDEPTASLDLAYQTGVFDLVVRLLRERGCAVLAAIHDLTLAAQYCHRIVLVHQGRLLVEGTAGKVLTKENLRTVYGVEADLLTHPTTGLPVVLPRPRSMARET